MRDLSLRARLHLKHGVLATCLGHHGALGWVWLERESHTYSSNVLLHVPVVDLHPPPLALPPSQACAAPSRQQRLIFAASLTKPHPLRNRKVWLRQPERLRDGTGTKLGGRG